VRRRHRGLTKKIRTKQAVLHPAHVWARLSSYCLHSCFGRQGLGCSESRGRFVRRVPWHKHRRPGNFSHVPVATCQNLWVVRRLFGEPQLRYVVACHSLGLPFCVKNITYFGSQLSSVSQNDTVPRPSCHFTMATTVRTGVSDAELVLRGGYVKKPIVLTQLRTLAGKQFLYLTKQSTQLSSFLCKERVNKHPLAKTFVFERLAKARDDVYKKLMSAGGDTLPVAPASQKPDEQDQLGLDDLNATATSLQDSGKKRPRKKDRIQIAPTATIELPMLGGNPWEVIMLMEPANKSPAIEATEANLQQLFDIVNDEIEHGQVRRPKYGIESAGSRPPPRGPRGERQYAVGQKWVTKIRAHAAQDPGPGDKKLRTLTRRRSGGDPPPPRGRKPGCAAAAVASSSSKGLLDGLDL